MPTNMPNLLPSIVRTVVPYLVGLLLTLALKVGIPLDSAFLTQVLTFAIGSLYYVTVRFVEHQWPATGILLGNVTKPHYVAPTPEAPAS